MKELMTIGKFISKMRKEVNYTQKDLADLLNVSNKTISSWENDNSSPDICYIPEIAKIFNITCDELLNCKKNGDDVDVEVKRIKKENNSLRRRIYLSIIIVLSILLIGMIFLFFYMLQSFSEGYSSTEYKIVDGIAYKLNDDGKYSVSGLTKSNRDDHILILDEIDGIEVNEIDENAFVNETFDSIQLGKNIITIASQAFYKSYVQTIVLNEGLKKIETYAFRNSYIESLHLPDSVEYIGEGAFYECSRLSKVTGGKGLKIIDNYAFYNCSHLQIVELHGKMSIGQVAFSKCTSLEIVKLYEANYICLRAFEYSGVIKLYLKNSLKTVESAVFGECFRIREIYFNGSQNEFIELEIELINKEDITYHYNEEWD